MAEPLVVTVDERGAIDELWTVRVKPEVILVVGELVGVVLRVARAHPLCLRGLQLRPINPVTATPYFQCSAEDVVRIAAEAGSVSFRTLGCAPVEWRNVDPYGLRRATDGLKSAKGVSPQLDLPEAEAPALAGTVELAADRTLELCVEIGGYEGVTVRVDHIAPADFDAVCRSVRAAFLADKA